MTRLHAAIRSKNIESVEQALSSGCDINELDNKGKTPLSVACSPQGPRDIKILSLLLSNKKLDVNKLGKTPFGYDGSPALVDASYGESWPEGVSLLLKHKKIKVNKSGWDGKTALHLASNWANIDVMKLLLKRRGIDVNKADRDGYTAVHNAVLSETKEPLNLLLSDRRVDVNRQLVKKPINAVPEGWGGGFTPLHLAIEMNKPELMLILLNHPKIKNSLNKRSTEGDTPLELAMRRLSQKNRYPLMRKMGMNVPFRFLNGKDKQKMTEKLLTSLIIKNKNENSFVEPIMRTIYNKRTLRPINEKNNSINQNLGMIVTNKNLATTLVDMRHLKTATRNGKKSVRGLYNTNNYSVVPITKKMLNDAYKRAKL